MVRAVAKATALKANDGIATGRGKVPSIAAAKTGGYTSLSERADRIKFHRGLGTIR